MAITKMAVNLAAGLRDNPEREGQSMNIHPSELFYIQAEDEDSWTLLELFDVRGRVGI